MSVIKQRGIYAIAVILLSALMLTVRLLRLHESRLQYWRHSIQRPSTHRRKWAATSYHRLEWQRMAG